MYVSKYVAKSTYSRSEMRNEVSYDCSLKLHDHNHNSHSQCPQNASEQVTNKIDWPPAKQHSPCTATISIYPPLHSPPIQPEPRMLALINAGEQVKAGTISSMGRKNLKNYLILYKLIALIDWRSCPCPHQALVMELQ